MQLDRIANFVTTRGSVSQSLMLVLFWSLFLVSHCTTLLRKPIFSRTSWKVKDLYHMPTLGRHYGGAPSTHDRLLEYCKQNGHLIANVGNFNSLNGRAKEVKKMKTRFPHVFSNGQHNKLLSKILGSKPTSDFIAQQLCYQSKAFLVVFVVLWGSRLAIWRRPSRPGLYTKFSPHPQFPPRTCNDMQKSCKNQRLLTCSWRSISRHPSVTGSKASNQCWSSLTG